MSRGQTVDYMARKIAKMADLRVLRLTVEARPAKQDGVEVGQASRHRDPVVPPPAGAGEEDNGHDSYVTGGPEGGGGAGGACG